VKGKHCGKLNKYILHKKNNTFKNFIFSFPIAQKKTLFKKVMTFCLNFLKIVTLLLIGAYYPIVASNFFYLYIGFNLAFYFVLDKVLFYPLFQGNYNPSNHTQPISSFYCRTAPEDCPSGSTPSCSTAYSSWGGDTTVFSLFFQCSGAYLELIQFNFSGLNPHTSIEVNFDLLTLNDWQNDNFTLYVDNDCNDNFTLYVDDVYNNQSLNFTFDNESYCNTNSSTSNETGRLYNFHQTIPHNQSTLNLRFRAEFNSYMFSQSMVIQNFELYLNSDCDSSCLTCDGQNECTCPFNSTLNTSTNICVCPKGWYMSTDYAHCVECDILCEDCNGPSNCTSCFSNLGTLSNDNVTCIPISSFLLFFVKFLHFFF